MSRIIENFVPSQIVTYYWMTGKINDIRDIQNTPLVTFRI